MERDRYHPSVMRSADSATNRCEAGDFDAAHRRRRRMSLGQVHRRLGAWVVNSRINSKFIARPGPAFRLLRN